MQSEKRRVAILGSTGSIGVNAVKVIADYPDEFEVVLLSARHNINELMLQCAQVLPKYAVIQDFDDDAVFESMAKLYDVRVFSGDTAYKKILDEGIEIDILVLAISGFEAVIPCMILLPYIKILAIANKECIVCLGSFLLQMAKKYGVQINPIDSEHNSLWQLLYNLKLEHVKSIAITASGGPFWNSNINLADVTPEMAKSHPTWQMGVKNSIDSATFVNKGLELIEAAILFELSQDRIDVFIHPQSVIHAMVTMKDMGTFALLSNPDMKFHIANAMRCNAHDKACIDALDLVSLNNLQFFAVDNKQFPALKLARQALVAGQGHVITFNAVNEVMVELFCLKKVKFIDIVPHIEMALDVAKPISSDDLSEIVNYHRTTRERVLSMML